MLRAPVRQRQRQPSSPKEEHVSISTHPDTGVVMPPAARRLDVELLTPRVRLRRPGAEAAAWGRASGSVPRQPVVRASSGQVQVRRGRVHAPGRLADLAGSGRGVLGSGSWLLRCEAGESPEQPVDRVLCCVACGERPEGGLVGRETSRWPRASAIGSSSTGRTTVIAAWRYSRSAGRSGRSQHAYDVSVASDHRRRGLGADAF